MKPDLPVEVSGQQTLGIFRRYFKKPAYPQEGSVTGNGQFSNYVRGKMDLECNGQTNDPGHLRDFDLKPFRGNRLLPNNVRDKVLEWTDGDKDVCLYAFFCRMRRRLESPIIPVAWVLTTGCRGWPEDEQGKHLGHWAAKNDNRYQATADWLAEQLGWKPGEPWAARPEGQLEEFVANADDKTLDDLGTI